MIDHILGRPSTRFRKYQVFTVVLLWSIYLAKFPRHGPPGVQRISRWLSKRFTMHQAVVVSCVGLYVSRNFARVVGLESPEPLANLYERSFFRATWVTTALDAGFWTAMHLRPKWLRSICEIVFTIYYLVCAEQADEMVKRVRGDLSLDHLRVSWNKPNTPILKFVTGLLRPKLMNYPPRKVPIERPKNSDYRKPMETWMYFNGSRQELLHQDRIILDIPGGGFVAMDPRCHDDKLMAWAAKSKCPVVALNYGKAPEHPYPYALHECYDAYFQIITTRGRCLGLSGECIPRIIVSGDSAGGNLAIAMTLLLLDDDSQHSSWQAGARAKNTLPPPEAICAIYPALEMNIGNWMTDEQLSLLRRPQQRKENKEVLRRKSEDYRRLTPSTPYASDDEDSDDTIRPTQKAVVEQRPTSSHSNRKPATRLAMSSMISYFNDRIISPEMLRAMILLYIGEYNRPDFQTDYFLSPLRAPEQLLSKFPRTFLLCGERDPLVDDTAIFAGRLRQAHGMEFKRRQELGLESEDARFNEKKHVEVHFVPGVSHGFLQFVSVYPAGWQYIHKCARWMRDLFDENDKNLETAPSSVASNGVPGGDYFNYAPSPRSRRGSVNEERPLEIPSKLRMTSITGGGAQSSHHRRRGSGGTSGSGATRSRGRVQRTTSGRKSPAEARHFMISRLSSNEDLVSRRMNGVTQNLGMDSSKERP